MELNLYGVASIQLDRLKGKKMRLFLLAATLCKFKILYNIVLVFVLNFAVGFLFPHATNEKFLAIKQSSLGVK